MGREDPDSPPSRGKQQRSPMAGDELAEEAASKRRRHHRHQNHHHHHRRHGKHDREKDEAEADATPSAPLLETEAPPQLPNPCDDEREEGEILEEEEPARGSDVESGEIEPGELDADQNPAQILNNHGSSICAYDDRGDGEQNMDDLRGGKKRELVNGRDSSKNYVVKEDSDGEIEPGTLLPKDEHDARVGSEARYTRSKTHSKGSDREKKHRGVERGNSRSQPRSRSPNSVESLHAVEDSKRADNKARGLDGHEKMSDSMQYVESSDGNKKALDKKDRGVSSERNTDKNTGLSPEPYHRGRSRSREHKKEKSNEHVSELYLEASSLRNHYDSRSYDRTVSEHEQVVRHDVVNRHVDRDRENDRSFHRERARSRSYSRHDQRDDRHGSRERDRDRESYYASVKHIKDVDEESHRERERSSSYSRLDGRKDSHGSQDRGRDRERHSISSRDREREKQRDASRERYRDSDRFRGSNSEKERVKDVNDRDRSHMKNREHRDCEEQMWKDRGFRERHRDSRHKYEDEYRKDKSRQKEFFKDSKYDTRNVEGGKETAKMEENEEVYLEKIESQLAKQEEEDVDRIKEESRKRRQAIMEKYKQQKQIEQHVLSPPQAHGKDKGNILEPNSGSAAVQGIHEELEDKHDPSDIYVADPSFTVGKSSIQNGASSPERSDGTRGLGEGTPKSERSTDMFCDDIFGESPSDVRKSGKGDELQIERSGLHDNWDDAEGYYSYRVGEVLDSRFEVKSFHGKGVFSTVVRAKDLKGGKGEPEEVAIKIIRNNDTMYKAGLEELVILKKLVGADPDDRRHCVRFLSSFKFRNHLCLVFESLHMNLREVLKKFGRNIGLNLTAVRAYAKQLFIALKHLRSCGVLHCDIKPDNMLVNEAKNVLKLCDFGNAMFAGKNEITPYLVSRFYRAPEIILGLPYDHPMDIWSVGCCLYELYTGKVLFPGPSNNDMLRLHMELKGPFPKKMLRKGAFIDQHFDQDLNFHAIEEDPVTKKTVRRLLLNIKQKDIGALLSSSPGEDPRMLANFKDLLERIFTLDPEKRMTVYQALSHPFITGK